MFFKIKRRKRKSDQIEENICVRTRACNEELYTETYAKKFRLGRAVGGSLALITLRPGWFVFIFTNNKNTNRG